MRHGLYISTMCLCFLGGALPAHAARDATSATIAEMTIGTTTGNVLFLRVTPAPVGTTACHQNTHWHYSLPLDTALGKNMYALLLSLIATGQPIGLGGLGVCNEYTASGAGIESLRGIGATF